METVTKQLKGSDLLHALDSIEDLKTVPVLLHKIVSELSNPEADIEEVAGLVLQDHVLTAKVLRLVNSPYLGLSREVNSLKQAIVLLGLRRIRDIVLTTLLMHQYPVSGVPIEPSLFWAHALGCAQGAILLDVEKKYPENDVYYISGLIHDIGEVILAQYFPNEFSLVYELAREKAICLYVAEREVLGITHCEIGALLAEKWNFPAELRNVILYHHTPEESKEDRTLISVVHLADLFTRLFGLSYNLYESLLISIKEQPSYKILKEKNPDSMDRDWEVYSMEIMDRFQRISRSVRTVFEI